ncbi:MAG TPA: YihY/virulence factor BrkB family protein [Gemmatimonadaceae bacterium]|jgi:membrane protein|nr:YihY/virulence factor BrkB family protein [Gemmatimonadaceae bacterium]
MPGPSLAPPTGMVIKGYRVGPLLKKTASEVLRDNVPGLAAQTAYYFFFSLFPIFLFLAPFISLIGDEQEIVSWIMSQLAATVPAEAIDVVRNVVVDVVFSPDAPGLMSIGLLLAAWAGSNVFNNLIDALNRAYDVTDTRAWWKKRLIALACVSVSAILLASAATIMLAGPDIVRWLSDRVGLGPVVEAVWMVLQYVIAFAFLVGMMFLIYYFLPNLRQKVRQILVGSVVASLLWVLGTLAFRFYVVNFGSYNKTYGTIGGVIVLLTWMYLTMLVILIGGELNSELHHGTGALQPRKGAVYQGRIVTELEPGRTSNERVDPVSAIAAAAEGSRERHA